MSIRRKDRNTLAITFLKQIGYPLPRIRLSLHRLTGITQPQMAEMIGVTRQVITHHIAGRRHTPEIQDAIARIWQVPKEELFEDGKPAQN